MKKKNDKKKKPAPVVKSAYPTDWLYLAPEEVSVSALRDHFRALKEVDVECWGDLGVIELTFLSKRYIDFEKAPLPLGDEAVDALAQTQRAAALYMVSAEPVCTREELDFLRETQAALGGAFFTDDEALKRIDEV